MSASAEVYLVPEIACCRVVRSSSVEILQRVPPGTADLLRIGSIEPGALLLDASDAFDSGSPNADEAARSITHHDGLMEEAIHQCVEAAVVSRVCSFACLGYAVLESPVIFHSYCDDFRYNHSCAGRIRRQGPEMHAPGGFLWLTLCMQG